MRIQVIKMMRIHANADPDADPDPQHWSKFVFCFVSLRNYDLYETGELIDENFAVICLGKGI
jgi:hypothetical protein